MHTLYREATLITPVVISAQSQICQGEVVMPKKRQNNKKKDAPKPEGNDAAEAFPSKNHKSPSSLTHMNLAAVSRSDPEPTVVSSPGGAAPHTMEHLDALIERFIRITLVQQEDELKIDLPIMKRVLRSLIDHNYSDQVREYYIARLRAQIAAKDSDEMVRMLASAMNVPEHEARKALVEASTGLKESSALQAERLGAGWGHPDTLPEAMEIIMEGKKLKESTIAKATDPQPKGKPGSMQRRRETMAAKKTSLQSHGTKPRAPCTEWRGLAPVQP